MGFAVPNVNNWFVVDLTNKRLGRAASSIAKLLNTRLCNTYGERASAYKLLIVNLNKLQVSERLLRKCYWHHSGYPGGLKRRLASQFTVCDLFVNALTKMLPSTKVRRALIRNVRLFKGLDCGAIAQRATYLEL
ncbi:MAG: 50S ribosomal protein L13 [Candidatus Hodgkinia cicadicola]|nr:MAG: 50S ribosomal protein L13 [Candidatus Hodgkinia cicadicola]